MHLLHFSDLQTIYQLTIRLHTKNKYRIPSSLNPKPLNYM